ncbi:hypothetical protein FB600_14412 [Burkholderia sp. SJZ089]|nr:hypothetical protein FB600_14412 [Burkholderia sp. SJZ089]
MIELVALDRPVDADVLNDATVLLVVLSPVEVEVDNNVIELLTDERPVDVEDDKLVMLDVTVLATA